LFDCGDAWFSLAKTAARSQMSGASTFIEVYASHDFASNPKEIP